MEENNIITTSDLQEPYSDLMYILTIEEILQVERLFRGRQILFKKTMNQVNYSDLINIIGEEKTRKIIKLFEGEKIYFHDIRNSYKKMMSKEFDGSNYSYLARKYRYCERSVRNIIKDSGKPKVKKMDGQISLFD